MKNTRLLILGLFVFFVSCIPSLHPIYTDQTKIFDDRILGNWTNKSQALILENLKINSDTLSSIELGKIEKEIKSGNFFDFDSDAKWRFARAAKIRYYKQDSDGSSSSITLENQMFGNRGSILLAEGYSVVEIDELDYYVLEYEDLSDDDNPGPEIMKVNLTKINGDMYMDFEPLPETREATRFSVNHIPAHTFAKVLLNDDKLTIKSFDSEFIDDLIKSKRVRLKHEIVEETIILTASTDELRAFIEKYGSNEDLYMDDEELFPYL